MALPYTTLQVKMIGDDYPKVGRETFPKTASPKAKLLKLFDDFPVYVIKNKIYVISNYDPARLLDVREIKDIEKLTAYANMFKKMGMSESDCIIDLCSQVGSEEAREVLTILGLENKADIMNMLPAEDEGTIAEICQRYGIN